VRCGVILHGDPAGVPGGHTGVVGVRHEGSILEGPQHVESRLAGAVHEGTVYPGRDVIQLDKKIWKCGNTISKKLTPKTIIN